MSDTIVKIGFIILGVFLVATLTLGGSNSMKTNIDSVTDKGNTDMTTHVTNDTTNTTP